MYPNSCPNCGTPTRRDSTTTPANRVCQVRGATLARHPPEEASSPAPWSAAAPPSPLADESPHSFFTAPYVAVLCATALALCCICPLSLFFEAPRGLLLLFGMGFIFGGFLWLGYRFKAHTGENMTDEAPWYLRGGLATMLQVTGYVIQEPRVFGPPFSLVVLGGVLCLSPIWVPDWRWSKLNPFPPPPPPPLAAAPSPPNSAPPPAEAAASTPLSTSSTSISPSSPVEPVKAPPAVLKSPTDALRMSEMAYLSDLEAFDIQGPVGLGRQGNLGDGNRIVTRGQASPRGLGMHPPDPPARSRAGWRLASSAATLRGSAGLNDTAEMPWGAAIFTVSGDGNVLWTSAPIKKRGEVVEFEIDVRNVDLLELSVHVEGLAHYVHAVWIEPRLERAVRE